MRQKSRDLLDLTPETDVEILVNDIVRSEPLISEQRKPQLRKLIYKLIEKIDVTDVTQNFYLFKARRTPAHAYARRRLPALSFSHGAARARSSRRSEDLSHLTAASRSPAGLAECPQILRAHILPLTNCAFNKSGDRFITGSYDRTCKVPTRTCMHVYEYACVQARQAARSAPGPGGLATRPPKPTLPGAGGCCDCSGRCGTR